MPRAGHSLHAGYRRRVTTEGQSLRVEELRSDDEAQ